MASLWNDTYLMVETADQLLSQVQAWQSLSAETKEQIVREATRSLDYALEPWGEPVNENQFLQFPRAIFENGSADEIKKQQRKLARATALLIEYTLNRTPLGVGDYSISSETFSFSASDIPGFVFMQVQEFLRL